MNELQANRKTVTNTLKLFTAEHVMIGTDNYQEALT